MKMTDKTFNNLRFFAEIVGYILVFITAVSDIMGFKYGTHLTAIVGAFGILMGNIVEACRRKYNEDNEEEENV